MGGHAEAGRQMPEQRKSRSIKLTREQEVAAADLLRLRRSAGRAGYEQPGLDHLLLASAADPAARLALGLDGGAPRRLSPAERRRKAPPDLAGHIDKGGPGVEAMREAAADAARMWPAAHLAALTPIVDAVVAALPEADAAAVERWAQAALMAGAVQADGDQFFIADRERFKEFAGLNDHQLVAIERAAGHEDAPARVAAAALGAVAGDLGVPKAIVAGTSHTYVPKGSFAVGRISVKAGEEDAASGSAELGAPIFHQVRTAAYWMVEAAGRPGLVRGITRPLVAPIDISTDTGQDAAARERLHRWLRSFGLLELLEAGDVSATLQQASAAAALASATPDVRLPIVLPAIRVEAMRSGVKFPSPLGDFEREMPGNSIAGLDGLRRLLDGRCSVWLAETAVEEASGRRLAEPAWRVLLPSRESVHAHRALELPDLFGWKDVYEVPGLVRVRELEHPVALSAFDPRGNFALLQVAGQPDPESATMPVAYFVASRSLRGDSSVARAAGETLLRLHGDEQAASTLRHARVAAVACPARVLRGRAKQPAQCATRELERHLAGLARLLLYDPHPAPVTGRR